MSTDRKIDVYFFNEWGGPIKDVKVKFSTSKSSVESNTYDLGDMDDGTKSKALTRHYQTGVGSEYFDYWYVEFTSDGDGPVGKFWLKNNFSCVIDSSIPESSELHFWVAGGDKCAYTGFPNSDGGYPGEGGYDGTPKNDPGSDYTCYASLDSDQ